MLAFAGLGTGAALGATSTTSSSRPLPSATAAWLSRLAKLRTFEAAAAADEQEELAPPLSLAAANGHRTRHQAVFMTSCMEQLYFWTYCAPFVSSFAAAFGREQEDGSVEIAHSILIATVGVPEASVAHVHVRFPFARFFALDEHVEELSSHEDPTEAENYRRLSYQSLKLKQYGRIWQEEVINSDVGFVVCMDSDMLMAKPFDHVFEYLAQRRVDVAFTYYDGKREVPWGTADELARTKGHGYVRLQGGMLVMRNGMEALHWFALWTSLTQSMLRDVRAGVGQQERWQALYKEFKGPSQAALAFLLTQGQIEQLQSEEECCSAVRSVMLEALRKGDPDVEVRMLGIPARFLNDAESTEDGTLPRSVHVVHLKGHWWRTVLPDGLEHIVVPTRSYEWNREAFELWRRHHAEFAFAFEGLGGEGRGEG